MVSFQEDLTSWTASRWDRTRVCFSRWQTALVWGTGLALVHRVVLMVWTSAVWLMVGPYTGLPPDIDAHTKGGLPPLKPHLLSVGLGVWRRWDAIHYLNLATFGYRVDNPGPTVFGVLTPFSFRLLDRVLPGPVDVAAAVVETLAFAVALILLFRLVEIVFEDVRLAKTTVLLTALVPISYFFVAPTSESIYLASVLLFFYAAWGGQWLLAGVGGCLATLTRSQGVALAGIGGVMLIQQTWRRDDPPRTNIGRLIRAGWPLILIPLAYWGFLAYRQSLNLPPLADVYRTESFVFFTDPASGIYFTLRHLVHHPLQLLTEADFQAMLVCAVLGALLIYYPRHRRLPMILYTWGYLLVFFTKVDRGRFSGEVTYPQSFARYTLALFPLTILFADRVLLRVQPATRSRILAGLLILLLVTSARHILYFAGP
jgi:hypothetical protein